MGHINDGKKLRIKNQNALMAQQECENRK
jgi:hypothetical protein